MSANHVTGPCIVTGYVPGSGGSNPEAGPGATYQGDCVLDPRSPALPGSYGAGHVKGFFNNPYPTLLDAVPAAANATVIVNPAGGTIAAGTVTNGVLTGGTALAMRTAYAAGRAPGMPLVPFGQQLKASNVRSVFALDPGNTSCIATSGSATLTAVGDVRMLRPGQPVAIPGAGSGSGVLVSRVLSVSKAAKTATLADKAGTTVGAAVIVLLDPTGVSVCPGANAGAVQVFDPASAISRNITVVSNNVADTGLSVLVRGYDVFLNPVSEIIAVTANATTAGKKAFKYVESVTAYHASGITLTGTLGVGTGDVFGIPLRAEKFEQAVIYWAGATVTASTGFTAALGFDVPATQSGAGAADVRGTYAVQSASDGAKRLVVVLALGTAQLLDTSYGDTSSLVGVAQA